MLHITTNDLLNLIEKSENTDTEKAQFKEIVATSEITEGVACLQLIFENGENVLLKGITMQNLIFNDLK